MSRIIDILSEIIDGTTYDAPAMSRAEEILKSIANGTSYSRNPLSRYEELLLAIKNGYGIGHNLFDKNNYEELKAKTDGQAGKIVDSDTERTLVFKCKPNTTYSYKKLKGTTFQRYMVAFSEGKPSIGSPIVIASTTERTSADYYDLTFTTTASTNYFCIWYYCTGSELSQEEMNDSLMVNEGETSLPYEPYTEIQYPQTRIEEILVSIANGNDTPNAFQSELEAAFIEAADKLKGE